MGAVPVIGPVQNCIPQSAAAVPVRKNRAIQEILSAQLLQSAIQLSGGGGKIPRWPVQISTAARIARPSRIFRIIVPPPFSGSSIAETLPIKKTVPQEVPEDGPQKRGFMEKSAVNHSLYFPANDQRHDKGHSGNGTGS